MAVILASMDLFWSQWESSMVASGKFHLRLSIVLKLLEFLLVVSVKGYFEILFCIGSFYMIYIFMVFLCAINI